MKGSPWGLGPAGPQPQNRGSSQNLVARNTDHEDTNGAPVAAPDHQRPHAPVAAPDHQRPHAPLPAEGNASTASVRRPARGLVTLRACPDAAPLSGFRALCTVSAEGDLTLWGGPDFDMQLLHAPLSRIAVSISEDPAQGEMFALACNDAPDVPTVYCFARDPAGRNRWLDILRRRGVQVSTLHPGE